MRSQDNVAYLGAISLLMSLAELFVPRPLPFFRLGLANIPILMGLGLDIRSFIALLAVKAIGNSYVSGTLFSLFAIMSLSQTFASGMLMYLAKKLCRSISIYSISLLGALASSIVQIAVASLYAGDGALMFLPLMLALSLPSAILVAYLSGKIELPEHLPEAEGMEGRRNTLLPIASLVISAGSVLMMENIPLLAIALIAALAFQKRSGRKIKMGMHIMTLAFMVFSSLLTPEGRVLCTVLSYPITENALLSGIAKALSLSAAMALSQGFSTQLSISSGIAGRTLYLFSLIETSFRNAEGPLNKRVHDALELKMYNKPSNVRINIPKFTLFALLLIFLILNLLDILFF